MKFLLASLIAIGLLLTTQVSSGQAQCFGNQCFTQPQTVFLQQPGGFNFQLGVHSGFVSPLVSQPVFLNQGVGHPIDVPFFGQRGIQRRFDRGVVRELRQDLRQIRRFGTFQSQTIVAPQQQVLLQQTPAFFSTGPACGGMSLRLQIR